MLESPERIPMAEFDGRRKRPVISCTLCRRRKIRCNRELPCSNCIRSKCESACEFTNRSSQPSQRGLGQRRPAGLEQSQNSPGSTSYRDSSSASIGLTTSSHPTSSLPPNSATASIHASHPSPQDVENLQIKDSSKSFQSPQSTTHTYKGTMVSSLGRSFFVHRDVNASGRPQTIARGITHKTRTFGQSHWINGAALGNKILDLCNANEPYIRQGQNSVLAGMKKSKSLSKVIKSQRNPAWPSPPTIELPTKEVVDELVDCYVRTTESVFRILHLPTFQRNYEALWASDSEPDMAFVVQLKLVLAIGATTYDDKFSLRTSAVRWVYQAQTWLAEPNFKSRLDVDSLQTNILLLIARELVDVQGDLIWISAGELVRRAIYMGLHRDPARLPDRTVYAAEMHRRLWNTILELSLQSSLGSGAPPLISPEDFDTEPPSNFDDDQLLAENPVSKPEDVFTQISIAICLRKTFNVRLAVTKFLNDLNSTGTYEDTLRLDSELRAAFKTLRRTLQEFNSSNGPSPARFEICVVDFLMNRYVSALHIPFFGATIHETAHLLSKKIVVEAALQIWCAIYPSSSIVASQVGSETDSADRISFARLAVCANGFYRLAAIQATMLIAVELITQFQEENSLGPVLVRPDLVSVLEDAKAWCLQAIEAGQTNIKGHLFMSVISAHVDGLRRGLGKDGLVDVFLKAAEDSQQRCLPILEKLAAEGQAESSSPYRTRQTPWNPSVEPLGGWDLNMSEPLFNPASDDLMNWMFGDGYTQDQPLW